MQQIVNALSFPAMTLWLRLYYAATLLFLLLDYFVGINVRVAFLENQPLLRGLYYLVLFACLALMLLRPGWAEVIGAVESLTLVIALIFNMALRVLVVSDEMLETGAGLVTSEEIINFLISGSIAYLSWITRIKSLKVSKI